MGSLDLLRRHGWILILSLVLGWGLGQLALVERVERWIGDIQQHLVARELFFQDAVVLDIDESSLRKLQPLLGPWPYSRDIYALVLDYLNEKGAAAVVFDILLSDPRPKDDVLAASLSHHGNGVLVAAAPTDAEPMSPAEAAQLPALGWAAPAALPRAHHPALLLPNPTLVKDSTRVSVGVVAAEADQDGILRRLPLLHEVAGTALPSLPLAAMQVKGGARSIQAGTGGWWLGTRSWPIDADGSVHLYFPSNANAILTLPFHEVAEAALGAATLKNATNFFRGKTVFIGSTAYLSDRVNTPRGPMSGTYALATAHQSLTQGLVWRPAGPVGNLALMACAALALYLLTFRTWQGWQAGLVWLLASAAVLYVLNLALLALAMQQTALLPAMLALFIGFAAYSLNAQAILRQRTRALEREADLDSLTGLPVRRAFLRAFEREIAMAKRDRRPLSIAILDLDHFKRVNDTYGHPVGDLVLKTFARVLKASTRTTDFLGRWGGEEFVVLLPSTDAQGAVKVLDKLRLAISAESFPPPADALKVTMSAGLTEYDYGDATPEAIVGQADLALYEAKESGRNRICVKTVAG